MRLDPATSISVRPRKTFEESVQQMDEPALDDRYVDLLSRADMSV